jgi:3-vinyl bacteriochlorophyllide hydratase
MSVNQPASSRQKQRYIPRQSALVAMPRCGLWCRGSGASAVFGFCHQSLSGRQFSVNDVGFAAATIIGDRQDILLYAIMVTGAIWEKVVFGRYLFAPAFFWEDVVSMLVMALHTAYVVMWLMGWGTPAEQMWVALAAYATYVVNALQFLLKFQAAAETAPMESTSAAPTVLGVRERWIHESGDCSSCDRGACPMSHRAGRASGLLWADIDHLAAPSHSGCVFSGGGFAHLRSLAAVRCGRHDFCRATFCHCHSWGARSCRHGGLP